MKKLFTISLLAILLLACTEKKDMRRYPIQNLPQNEAGEVLKKAIAYAGGWDAWKRKKNFSFYKKISHVDSTGAISRVVKQYHQYNLGDLFQARMSWKLGEAHYVIVNNGYQAKKYLEGVELSNQKAKDEAWNSSFGSHYVISMPYKLLDSGCEADL